MNEISGAKGTSLSASTSLKSGSGKVFGVIVSSHTGGTMKLWDSLTATGTVLVETFTFPAGSGIYKFPEPLEFYTGLYFTVGGTLVFTPLYV